MNSNLKNSITRSRSRLPSPLPNRQSAIGNRQSSPPPPRSERVEGLHLLELLVVIGIILVLIGLFFAGRKNRHQPGQGTQYTQNRPRSLQDDVRQLSAGDAFNLVTRELLLFAPNFPPPYL